MCSPRKEKLLEKAVEKQRRKMELRQWSCHLPSFFACPVPRVAQKNAAKCCMFAYLILFDAVGFDLIIVAPHTL